MADSSTRRSVLVLFMILLSIHTVSCSEKENPAGNTPMGSVFVDGQFNVTYNDLPPACEGPPINKPDAITIKWTESGTGVIVESDDFILPLTGTWNPAAVSGYASALPQCDLWRPNPQMLCEACYTIYCSLTFTDGSHFTGTLQYVYNYFNDCAYWDRCIVTYSISGTRGAQ